MFSREICKNFKNTEQWLLLTFNSYFQRSLERKPVWLLAINTRQKSVDLNERDNSEFFLSFYFSILSFLNLAMTKWFCCVTCSRYFYLYIKKLFCNVTHQMRCYHFSIVKIINEDVSLIEMSKLNRKVLSPWWRVINFYRKVLHIKTQAEKRRMWL